jgi:hypothetical protein
MRITVTDRPYALSELADTPLAIELTDDEGVRWASGFHADHGGDAGVLIERLVPDVGDRRRYMATTTAPFCRPAIGATAAGRLLSPDSVWPLTCHATDPALMAAPVHHGRVRGRFWCLPNATGPAVVCVPGSSGGIDGLWAPALASAGYRVLAPALFGFPGRPADHQAIELETLADAVAWLADRTGCARVALLGSSRGTEAVMLAATHCPARIAAVIAFAPGNVVTPGFSARGRDEGPAWSLGGRDLPYRDGLAEALGTAGSAEGDLAPAAAYAAIFSDPDALALAGIPVEDIQVPLLLVAGSDDRMWPSALATRALHARAEAAGRTVRALILDGAGHLIWPPGVPTTLTDRVFHPVERRFILAGGTPEAQRLGNRAAWAAARAFIDDHAAPAP